MESRISIEVDFENGNKPVIQILHKESEDTRDSLISHFLQSRAHLSRWLTIQYKGEKNGSPYYHLHSVTPDDLETELPLMKALFVETIEKKPKSYPQTVPRPKNRIDLMSPTEKAITEAMYSVETIGAGESLTKAGLLLAEARDLVYNWLMERYNEPGGK